MRWSRKGLHALLQVRACASGEILEKGTSECDFVEKSGKLILNSTGFTAVSENSPPVKPLSPEVHN